MKRNRLAILLALCLLGATLAGAEGTEALHTPGSYVTFGRYPQTGNGGDRTPIEWLVLDYDGTNNRALLISRYGLDAKPYNAEWADTTWEGCTLRAWLNGTFLNTAFTEREQAAILTTTVENGDGQGYWSTNGGNNTEDKIFLLSYAEANKYLGVMYDESSNMKSRVTPTAYALQAGAWTSDNAGWWWLRSPDSSQERAACVDSGGSLGGSYVSLGSACVRPALWINLDAGIF